eukprot:m.163003 g.163003  ORF g.163003 m.163003 type:complete len:69 (+) comp13411_c0_seq8:1717-1923(+)
MKCLFLLFYVNILVGAAFSVCVIVVECISFSFLLLFSHFAFHNLLFNTFCASDHRSVVAYRDNVEGSG